MGPKSNKPAGGSSIADALFFGVQQRVLGALFGNADQSFYVNELMRLTGSGKGALLRELERLVAAGLVSVRTMGNQKHYQARRESPIFEELTSILQKTSAPVATTANRGHAAGAYAVHEPRAGYGAIGYGLSVPDRKLKALCRKYRIRKLSLFGSAARGTLTGDSDIDLMVEFEPDKAPSLWDFPEMQGEFSKLFGGRRVDLVPPQVLDNPHRRKAIVPDLKVLYAA
jgi:predicted nucleotidyltransferase